MTRYFGPPFDHSSADMIIRSSDDVDFKVHKKFMMAISETINEFPFVSSSDPGDKRDGLDVIPFLGENAGTIERFLRFAYPTDPPARFDNVEQARSLLDLSTKYQADAIIKKASLMIAEPAFARMNPLGVYALGCNFHLENLRVAGAQATLVHKNAEVLFTPHAREQLPYLSGLDIQHLLDYRDRCVKRILEALERRNVSEMCTKNGNWVFATCEACEADKKFTIFMKRRPNNSAYARKWFTTYIGEVRRLFSEVPDIERLGKSRLLMAPLAEAASCETCQELAGDHLDEFITELKHALQEGIALLAPIF
jgi:hypothetical protein